MKDECQSLTPPRLRGFACIGIHQPKFADNIGCVLRAAGCYSVDMVAVSGKRYSSSPMDTQRAWKHIPFLEVDDLRGIVPKGCVPVAVDLLPNARPLPGWNHPERAFYIFGGEDRTLSADVLSWCRESVYVPTAHCMNLAATVNVILYDRLCKRKARAERERGGGRG